MRTKTINLYTFDELSPSAKEKVRMKFREDVFTDDGDWDFVMEDAKECALLMGIRIKDIFFSGFCSQGDGASFTGLYIPRVTALEDIKAYAPNDVELHRIAEALASLPPPEDTVEITHRELYQHSGTMYIDEDSNELLQLLRDFADWIYLRLYKEYKYQMSDESIDGFIKANEYEFTEKGVLE